MSGRQQLKSSKSQNSLSTPQSPSKGSAYIVAWSKLKTAYSSKTTPQVKALDGYLLFCFVTGMLQLAYCIATRGAYYQAFLGGFIACVGSFVLAGIIIFIICTNTNLLANVRLQVAAKDKLDQTVPARAVAEFVLGSIILNVLIANFIMI
jgi:oligosaccharyltransferase complex subunit epsilon